MSAVTNAARATPYPYARWAKLGRREATAVTRFLRRAPLADTQVAELARELLGADARLKPGAPELVTHERPRRPGPVCAVLAPRDAGAGAPVVVDLAVDAAQVVVDRVLGGEGAIADADPTHLDALSRGVLGYLAARLLAAARVGYVLERVSCDDDVGAELGETPRLCWPVELRLGELRAWLRLWLPLDALERAAPPLSAARMARALRSAELALIAHAGHVTLTRDELASLAIGDAIVLDHCQLARGAEGFEGALTLHLAGARRTRYRASLSGRQLTLAAIDLSEEPGMGEGTRDDAGTDEAAVRLAGDAPVELCVELARFALPLEELVRLSPGQVLCTGRAIGEEVTLRAGGRAVARGELVEVDGEVGVRLTGLSVDEG